MMGLEEIRAQVSAELGEKRMRHTLGCAELARRLARRYGADEDAAYAAGLMHDVTKEIRYEDQLILCNKHGIILNNVQKAVPSLLHALTGACVARERFGAREEICSAIHWHTTGRADMTKLEKILWIADMVEPNRRFDGVDKLRELAFEDLDAALLCGFDQSIAYLVSKRQMIDTTMIDARNWLLACKSEKA